MVCGCSLHHDRPGEGPTRTWDILLTRTQAGIKTGDHAMVTEWNGYRISTGKTLNGISTITKKGRFTYARAMTNNLNQRQNGIMSDN